MPQTRRTSSVKAAAKRTSVKRVSKSTKAAAPKSLTHHAKRIYNVTPKFVHGMVAGAFVGVVVVMSLGMSQQAGAVAVTATRDCDDYAVIKCGALTSAELRSHYADTGVADIYSYFNITSDDITSINTVGVVGEVHDDGTVTVNQKVVATDASTAARKFVTGSRTVSTSGITYYVRPVKASFAHKTSLAYVVIKDGEFKFAVLGSCGNPVIATAVKAPVVPTPAPTKTVTPEEKPVVTAAPAPVPQDTPVPVVQPAAAVTTLPNTGPGALIIIGALAIIGGYIFHMTHRHVTSKKPTKQTRHHA